jgi:probable HAF family extracellular repeat protein
MRVIVSRAASSPFGMQLRLLTLCGAAMLSVKADGLSYANAPQFLVTDLGPVQSTGDSGRSINNAGTAAFTVSTAVYLWHSGVTTVVPNLFANNGPLAINDMGDIAGADNLRAFIYRNGVMTDLGTFNGGYTSARGLNNSNVVVGDSYDNDANSYRAFKWQGGDLQRLPAPGGTYALGVESRAYAINADGVIAGSYANQNPGGVAVVWNGDDATRLTTLSGYSRSEGYDINSARQVVGYSADAIYSKLQAVLWNGTTPTNLGSLPGLSFSEATAINASSMVVGWSRNDFGGDDGSSAFLWQNGQMLDLNLLISPNSGWHLTAAKDINDAGQIVGYGTLDGQQESFLLTPIPEPSSFALICLGLAALLACQCKYGVASGLAA